MSRLGWVFLATVLAPVLAPGEPLAEVSWPTPADFRLAGEKSLFDENHLHVASGTITVGVSLADALSTRSIYSVPWVSSDFRLDVLLDGAPVSVSDLEWFPHQVVRRGRRGEIALESTLLPLRQGRAFVELITLENQGSLNRPVRIAVKAGGTLDRAGPSQWTYSAPVSQTPLSMSVRRASGGDDDLTSLMLDLRNDQGQIQVAVLSEHPWQQGDTIGQSMTLLPGVPRTFRLLVVLGDDSDYRELRSRFDETLRLNRLGWSRLFEEVFSRVPQLKTDSPELQGFYTRGVLPLVTNRWELDELVTHPHYGEGGIDGGALCPYLWGFGYTAEFFGLTQPETSRAMIEQFLEMDMTRYFAYSPLDGSGIGRWYAYNNYSMVRWAYHYVLASGDFDFLTHEVGGKTVLEWLRQISEWPGGAEVDLVDYGVSDNLLELLLTENYQHFVPSPNAERSQSLRMVARLARRVGRPDPGLEKKAEAIERLVMDRLWNPHDRWMDSLDQTGKAHRAYSIQVFDLLRLPFPRTILDGLVSHLNEREFLSAFGVHSLSKQDPGYDERDVDWAGPGVYVGDAPELVEDLFKAGYPRQAEDLLQRILWWGERFPYLPQSIRADRMDYRRDGFSGCIAGMAVPQSIIFGVFGVGFPTESGEGLQINPHRLSFVGKQELENLRWRSHRIHIRVDTDFYTVEVDGRPHTRTLGEPFLVQP